MSDSGPSPWRLWRHKVTWLPPLCCPRAHAQTLAKSLRRHKRSAPRSVSLTARLKGRRWMCRGWISVITRAYRRVRVVVVLHARLLFLCLLMQRASWSVIRTPPEVPWCLAASDTCGYTDTGTSHRTVTHYGFAHVHLSWIWICLQHVIVFLPVPPFSFPRARSLVFQKEGRRRIKLLYSLLKVIMIHCFKKVGCAV